MNNTPFIFAERNGLKNFDFSPWGGIEGFLEAAKQGQTGNVVTLKQLVPDLAKAIDMTAVAVANMPFDFLNDDGSVFDSSADWQNELGGIPNPQKLLYLLASSLCGGEAYLIPTRTPKMIFDLQYAAPGTIEPYIDINGLQYFSRASPRGKAERYNPKELIYFWLPDSDVEIGPAENHPLGNAAADAQLVFSLKTAVRRLGERDFIPISAVGAKGMLSPDERAKAETFFTRLIKGLFNTYKVFNAEVLSFVKIGAGVEDLKGAYMEIRRDAKESIADAFSIPAPLFLSDNAYASEFDGLRKHWYQTGRQVSIRQTIEEVVSEQLLKQYHKRMRFNPEAMEIFQTEESERSANLSTFVSAISTDPRAAKLGMEILGYDLTEEQAGELDAIIADGENEPEPVTENETKPVTSEPVEELEIEKAVKANETSAMIALRIPDLIKAEIAGKYSFVDSETLQDLHITLVYLGDNRTIDKLDVIRAVSDLGMFQSPIKGRLQGLARFVSNGTTDPLVMTFDSPQAPKLYDTLCRMLDNYHVPYHKDYGFIPHMTLTYLPKDSDMPIETIEPIEINFSEVYYVDGNVWFPVDLVGYENKSKVFTLSAEEIKDLALWYAKAQAWHKTGKSAVDWENKHLREEIAAPIRLKLAGASSEQDVIDAFRVDSAPAKANDAALVLEGIRLALTKVDEPK